jgi:hypothetical protein
VAVVKVRFIKPLLLASVISLICGGCGGIAATPAFSPLMLLLEAKPAARTNAPPTQVASANRDSSHLD